MRRTIINPVAKDTITFLQTSFESNGQITELELILNPGGGNPLHFHKTFSQSFTAIEGELTIETRGKQIIVLKPGDSYVVAPNQVHRYFNNSSNLIKFKATVTPGHKGFEYSLRIGYGLAADGLSNEKSIPKSLKHKAVLLALGDINFAGAASLLSPVLRFLGKRVKTNGLQGALIDKYCY